jgi:hypothetical protein
MPTQRFFSTQRGLSLAIAVAILLLAACAAPTRLETPPPAATATPPLLEVQKVDDHPFYVMPYNGDYGFAEYLKTGVRPEGGSIDPADSGYWACSVFAALSADGQPVLGRNFDWYDHPALLLFTDSSDGYASVSMVDISYLGFDKETPLDDQTLAELKAAPYLPFDGMNEKGLAVGMMAITDIQPAHDPNKVTLGSLETIRLMLDYAATVDEALLLLEKYNVDFSGGPTIHYLIADASGHSAVVEYGDARKGQEARYIFRNTDPWQAATNFEFAPQPPSGASSGCWRYNTVYQTLSDADGKLTQPQAMAVLEMVSQPHTLWSVTYGLVSGQVDVVIWQQFDQVKTFQLEMAH